MSKNCIHTKWMTPEDQCCRHRFQSHKFKLTTADLLSKNLEYEGTSSMDSPQWFIHFVTHYKINVQKNGTKFKTLGHVKRKDCPHYFNLL